MITTNAILYIPRIFPGSMQKLGGFMRCLPSTLFLFVPRDGIQPHDTNPSPSVIKRVLHTASCIIYKLEQPSQFNINSYRIRFSSTTRRRE